MDSSYYSLKSCSTPPVQVVLEPTQDEKRYDDHFQWYTLDYSDDFLARFYITGIHCSACVWLLDQLPRLHSGIIGSRLDFGQSILQIHFRKGTLISEICSLIRALGYHATPLLAQEDPSDLFWKKERRQLLSQIGVAAFLAANIMLFSISLYAGATGTEGLVFEWLSAIFSIPVVFWLAAPFYRRAISGLLVREINIDLSVSLAVLGGFLASVWMLFHHRPHLYFDSITVFVFLLLSTRFLLRTIHRNLSYTQKNLVFGFPHSAWVMGDPDQYLPIQEIPVGSKIRIPSKSVVPLDGILLSDQAQVDTHLLTGESWPRHILKNEAIFALTRTGESDIIIQTTSGVSDSRMGTIFSQLEQAKRPPLSVLSDRVAKWFVIGIFILGAVVGTYRQVYFGDGLGYALGLLMVSCPCALALTTPLIYSLGIRQAAKKGILIQSELALDALLQCTHVFFDKTGTLTLGQLSVTDIKIVDPTFSTETAAGLICGLEQNSNHPIAKALRRHFDCQPFFITEVQEVSGKGVYGFFEGIPYFIGQSELPSNKISENSPSSLQAYIQIGLFRGTQQVMHIVLEDTLHPDSRNVVAELSRRGLSVAILSGDHEANVAHVSNLLNIPTYFSESSPETKYKIVSSQPRSMMIGDGVNDALALACADVGVAVHGSLKESLKTASLYMANHRLSSIITILDLAHQTRKTIWLTLSISTFYNFIGVGLVLSGLVSPLLAAVLMPVSSLSGTLVALGMLRSEKERTIL